MPDQAAAHFVKELRALINRFRLEYEMTYAEAIGCLWLVCHELAQEDADA